MPSKLITPVATQVLLAADVKARLKITDTSEDAVIDALIAEVRAACQNKTKFAIGAQTWTMALDEFPEQIQLEHAPLIAVTGITYTDPDGNAQTLATDQYVVDDFRAPAWIVPAVNITWPATFNTVNAVRVTYQCGYTAATLPESLKLWMLANIGHFHANREIFTADGGGDRTIVDGLLDSERRWEI